jgi:translation initiation factor eIF-2B subunit alpha
MQGIEGAVVTAWNDIKKEYSGEGAHASLGLNMDSAALKGSFDYFKRFVTKAETLADARARSRLFANNTRSASTRAAAVGNRFFRNGQTVMVHGHSPTLVQTLVHARKAGKLFRVLVTESRPSCNGYRTAAELDAEGVPVEVVTDTAVAAVMGRVDLVVCAADAVVESGGLISQVGTYQTALVAKALNKPFYVLAESYRFVRMFPLTQQDAEGHESECASFVPVAANRGGIPDEFFKRVMTTASCDYTPPEFVTLLFTDLGILPPTAVSDELITLHNA